MDFQHFESLINDLNYIPYLYSGTYYLAADINNAYSDFTYIFPNPVTLVEDTEDVDYIAENAKVVIYNLSGDYYIKTEFRNLTGDKKLRVDDTIKITVNGELLEGYFFGKPPASGDAIISFYTPLLGADLDIEVYDDLTFKDSIILTRTEDVITYSKLEVRIEPVRFLTSGGSNVVVNVNGVDSWLIKMPNDFVINASYQVGNSNEVAERWSIGTPTYSLIPDRAFHTVDAFTKSGIITVTKDQVFTKWGNKITQLLEQKY
jgi:hypothetical protein